MGEHLTGAGFKETKGDKAKSKAKTKAPKKASKKNPPGVRTKKKYVY